MDKEETQRLEAEFERTHIKKGDHYYLKTDTDVTWDDKLKEQESNLQSEIEDYEKDVEIVNDDIYTLSELLADLVEGLFTDGRTFVDILDKLDVKFHIFQWVSKSTIMMIEEERQIMIENWNFDKGADVFDSYLLERFYYLLCYFDPFDAYTTITSFLIISLLQAPGKLTVVSPMFGIIAQGIVFDATVL